MPYCLLRGMHRSTVLVKTKESEETSFGGFESFTSFTSSSPPTSASPTSPTAPDSPLGAVVRRRRSALDFDPQAEPMPRATLEQMLDLAPRDWPADWRGDFVLGKKEEGGIKREGGAKKKTWRGD